MLNKLICHFRGHRYEPYALDNGYWYVRCPRCHRIWQLDLREAFALPEGFQALSPHSQAVMQSILENLCPPDTCPASHPK